MLFLLLILSSFNAWSLTDSHWGFQGRSFPMIGGEFFGELGKSKFLWGKEQREQKKPFYGFTRGAVGGSSAVLVNSFKGEWELYLLSFFGVAVGYQQVHSNFDFPFFDCDEIYCRGRMERRYIEPRLGLGHAGYIMMVQYRLDHVQHSRSGRNFGEFRKVIQGKDGRDQFEETRVVLAKNFQEHMVGVIHEWSRFRLSQQQAHNLFAVYQRKIENQVWMVGLGGFKSNEIGLGPAVYLRYIHHLQLGPKIL